MNRGRILEAWRKKRSDGGFITGGRSGPDFIAVSNEDQLRLPEARGLAGLLPLGDANALSLKSAREHLAQGGGVPVLAGVCASDPLRLLDKFLLEMKAAGVAGVENLPSVGLIDGGFRTSLEEAALGYDRELELVRLGAELGLLTCAFAFTPEDAQRMARAGADALVMHPGPGPVPPRNERIAWVEAAAARAREVRPEILVFVHGRADLAPADSPALDGIQIE